MRPEASREKPLHQLPGLESERPPGPSRIPEIHRRALGRPPPPSLRERPAVLPAPALKAAQATDICACQWVPGAGGSAETPFLSSLPLLPAPSILSCLHLRRGPAGPEPRNLSSSLGVPSRPMGDPRERCPAGTWLSTAHHLSGTFARTGLIEEERGSVSLPRVFFRQKVAVLQG